MIGDNIQLRRKKMKLSQEALAKGDWTRSYISQIERGRIQPSLDTLSKIARKLDTTVAELVGDYTILPGQSGPSPPRHLQAIPGTASENTYGYISRTANKFPAN